jgi:16S rRNA (uracil1498-N3)-methyltransferase
VKQFLLTKEPDNNIVRLEGDDYRYLVRVRRLAVGEYFPALLPDGEETLVKVLSIDKNTLTGEIAQKLTLRSSSNLPPIILFQALPKGEKMDTIVRQAAEGGITEVVPFVSEFSVGRTNSEGQKFSRWERIIKEARQQCGSKISTTIHEPLTLDGLFGYWDELKGAAGGGSLGLLFHHRGLEQESLHSYLNIVPKLAVLAVGPEGGFSEKEVSLFLEKGFKPLTIGDTILRTETAALYCSAAVRILLLERNSWEPKPAQPKNHNV